jgi:hypothetical protein
LIAVTSLFDVSDEIILARKLERRWNLERMNVMTAAGRGVPGAYGMIYLNIDVF